MRFTILTTISTVATVGLASPVLHWHRQVNGTLVTNGTTTAVIAPLTTGIATTETAPTKITDGKDTDVTMSPVTDEVIQVVAKLRLEALVQLPSGETLAFSASSLFSCPLFTRIMAPQNADQGAQHIDMNVVPEVCRSECSRAYEESQRLYKTPELCRTNSVFIKDYASCRTCILHQGTEGDDWINANKFYLLPAIGEYAKYYDSIPNWSMAKTSSTSSRVAVTTIASSDTSTQLVATATLMTERPNQTTLFLSSSFLKTTSTTESSLETSTFATVISSVVKSPISSPPSLPPSTPSETITMPPLPGPPSISLTTTVIIVVIPFFSAILLIAGLIYICFYLRKRSKQQKAAFAKEDKEGSTLSKASTWEKGEMSARISTSPRQEMDDWRGVEDSGPHELPAGAPAEEIMDAEEATESEGRTTEERRMVADSPALSGSEMMESDAPIESPTLSSNEVVSTDAAPVDRSDAGSEMD